MRWGDAAAGEGPEVRLHPAVGGKGESEGREGKGRRGKLELVVLYWSVSYRQATCSLCGIRRC